MYELNGINEVDKRGGNKLKLLRGINTIFHGKGALVCRFPQSFESPLADFLHMLRSTGIESLQGHP